jgi:hypothetical protein
MCGKVYKILNRGLADFDINVDLQIAHKDDLPLLEVYPGFSLLTRSAQI